jgi:NAD+ kinase
MARLRTKAPSVLVVYKRTTYERFGGPRNRRITKLLAEKDPSVKHVLESHEAHLATLLETRAALARIGAKTTFVHRLTSRNQVGWDLVVTLGGDGTLLFTSHRIGRDIPMLAINSAPLTSVGFFCAGQGSEAEELITSALAGDLRATKLTRMQLAIDGRVFHRRVLNDVLFSHAIPAAATRYVLTHGDTTEEQLSSGLWVGPAAGSTAAQRSAGGVVLPPGSRKIQYVVREPYHGLGPRYQLERGLVSHGDSLSIRSKIREGMLYVDGHDLSRRIDVGREIVLSASDEPLTLLGLRVR